jgi:glycosyltransferase involved in cell wall biosynthesis
MDPLESVESVEATPLLDVPWTPGSVRVVGCGSLAPWKGPDLWLDAAERLSTVDGRRVEWMWIGAGDQLRFLRDETRQRGLEHRVHWMGERENVGPYLASGDLFVLTSRIEPLGLVLLEAAAAGVASIAFQTGGVREILVDERALVRAGNVGELVEKIRSALKSLALRSQLLEASRPALVESDPEVWRRHLAQVVAEAVRGEPAATPVP